MTDKPYTWEKRSEEWIKENPGKGTMYKKYIDGIEPEEKPVRAKIIPGMTLGKINNERGIYVIVCEIEKHVYVGQSINMDTRLRQHKMSIVSKGKDQQQAETYDKIRKHYFKHGIEAFEFKKHLYVGPEKEQLSIMENRVMNDFSQKGYTLYNMVISIGALRNIVQCPTEFKEVVEKTIDLLACDTEFKNKLETILK